MSDRAARPSWASRLHAWEQGVVSRFTRHERRPRLRRLMLVGTRGADGWALLAIVPGAVLVFGRRGLEAVGSGLVSGLVLAALVFAVKSLVRRARPADIELTRAVGAPDRHAFPSGHTAHAFNATTALFLLHPVVGLLFLPVAIVVGVSRVFFGLHYPSDVLAGAALGTGVSWAVAQALVAAGWFSWLMPAG